MKISIVANYYPPHIGGLEIVAQQQAQALTNEGHEVHVLTCSPQHQISGTTLESGVIVHRLKVNNFFENKFSIPFPFGGIFFIQKVWNHLKIVDVIIVHDVFYEISWLAYFCAYLTNKKILLVQHVGLVAYPNPVINFIQRCVYRVIGRRIFNYAKDIIVYNSIVKEFLLENHVDQSKIHQFRNGIDIARFTPANADEKIVQRKVFGLPIEKTIILFVGRLVPKKGFSLLFEARDPRYEIVFAGSGEIPDAWRHTLGVHFLGPIKRDVLANIYKTADIFALPTNNESFTLAMQEAMASGLPTLTGDNNSYQSTIIDREKIILTDLNTSDIKERIQEVLCSKAKLSEMSHYARNYAEEHFDLKKNIKPFLSLIINYV
jgi:rhamnosyl/mannosyltransferase